MEHALKYNFPCPIGYLVVERRFSLSLLAVFTACFSALVLTPANPSHALKMHTKAPHAIVYELGSDTVLFEHDADTAVHPSSMSKLMTLYLVFQHLNAGVIKMDDTFSVSESAWKRGGSSAFLKVGQAVTVSDLIRGVAVSSGNDACIVLSEGVSGSQEQFVEDMNALARELNMGSSNFTNVTGWPDDEHVMSVRDILTVSVRIFEDFPEYYHVFGEKQFTYNGVTQKNYNTLLNYNMGVDGIKTGHTEKAGYGIAASAARDNRRIFVVVNGLRTETERAYETKRLFLYAFNRFETRVIFPAGSTIGEVKVLNGKSRVIPMYVRDDIVISYPRDLSKNVKAFVSHKSKVAAPVKKDQEVGTLSIQVPGMAERVFPVYSAKDVKALGPVRSFFRSLYDIIFH
ncbi:D-alanyl-D-alanine carboxypeptidase family protein [Anaplasma capra]|uniref:D-alanyl-D-alanine carboxypeptidase family protein n=1 Tax=Anaplasma capra TaxID=1562740 RepID=UPI0021D5A037|nr:D-alanyl-D-alanine carboxypeptidase family protein [Anaplasma capra]MCU7611278.1 D-alanyl-D-alanine carboxypeptidase [Anaplasma capra]MCU7612707.1 D-alanyl-D-alanine carboxypeptidase [Anaplasma capra]